MDIEGVQGRLSASMSIVSGPSSGTYQSFKQRVPDEGTQRSDANGIATGDASARTGAASTSATPPVLDPSRVRSRIDTLIDSQVATGRLTNDQAGVLRQILSASDDRSGAVVAGDGANSPDPVVSGSDEGTDARVRTDLPHGTPTVASSTEDTRPSPSETLASFIQQLQRGQGRTVGYASDGSRNADLTSSRLLDFNT